MKTNFRRPSRAGKAKGISQTDNADYIPISETYIRNTMDVDTRKGKQPITPIQRKTGNSVLKHDIQLNYS
jgi:hypothetical protein